MVESSFEGTTNIRRAPPARHTRLIAVALIAAMLVAIEWPILKDAAYWLTGVQANGDGIDWRTDLDVALAEAKQGGKRVLVDFTASWCPPCQTMKRDVWPDAHVREMLGRAYVPLLIDVDRNPGVTQRYHVTIIPSILVLDHEGRVLQARGPMSRAELLEFLERQLSK